MNIEIYCYFPNVNINIGELSNRYVDKRNTKYDLDSLDL